MKEWLWDTFIPHKKNDFKPDSVRAPWLIGVAVFSICVTILTLSSSYLLMRSGMSAEVHKAILVNITNKDRIENNVPELVLNEELTRAAEMKAEDMITYGYFAHTSPSGVSPWHWISLSGYEYEHAGENLAIDFYDSKEVAEAWMNSPTHRRNILNKKYTDIGIAVKTGIYKGRRVAFVVQMFGTPKSVYTEEVKVAQEPNIVVKIEDDTEKEVLSGVLGESIEEGTESVETFMSSDEDEGIKIVEDVDGEVYINERNYVQPQDIGKGILLVVATLASLAILLNIGINIRKQHWENVFWSLGVLALVVLLYIFLLYILSSVTLG
jgi:hypothetical protein